MLAAGVERDLAGTLADGGACHVHGSVASPDDRYALANLGRLGAHEVVQAEEHVATRFSRDAKRLGAPGTRANKDHVIAVTEQVRDGERRSNGSVVPNLDAKRLEDLLEAIEHALGKAVLGNAVTHDAAKAWVLVKDRDGHAHLCEPHGRNDASRAAADDGCALTIGLGLLEADAIEIRARDVVLDGREVNGRAFATAHAVTLALDSVIADERADGAHGVVLEEHGTGLVHPALAEQLDDQRNGRTHRTTLLAKGVLAVKAALCLLDDVQCHNVAPLRVVSSFRHE